MTKYSKLLLLAWQNIRVADQATSCEHLETFREHLETLLRNCTKFHVSQELVSLIKGHSNYLQHQKQTMTSIFLKFKPFYRFHSYQKLYLEIEVYTPISYRYPYIKHPYYNWPMIEATLDIIITDRQQSFQKFAVLIP